MTEETAQKLIAALDRYTAALEKLTGLNSLGGGINVYRHGIPQPYNPSPYPSSPYEWRPTGELR